jgi:outer membrane protein OmpA-like peptidoglycan-associated protein
MTCLFARPRTALVAAMSALLLLASCGSKEETPESAPASSSAEEPEPEIGSGNPMKDMLDEQKRVEQEKRDEAFRIRDKIWEDKINAKLAEGTPESQQEAKIMRLHLESMKVDADPEATPEQKKAARDKLNMEQQRASRRTVIVKQPKLDLPPDWAATHREVKNAKEAELLVQVGDIDNLGFGWPPGFDPFSGKSTPPHRFPWAPEADDPSGTDRIMVGSGAPFMASVHDGYANETMRDENQPLPLAIEFDPAGVAIKGAVLQLFVDDFQAPELGSQFLVTLDGRSAPDIETTVNKLSQTGPVGKLVTIKLLPEYLDLLADGKLAILVDDPTTESADGFAIDFARLLINPKGFTYSGAIRGIVVDKESGQPVNGALVSAANMQQATTGADGKFELKEVPAGLVVTTGSHPDYVTGSEQEDLLAGQVIDIVLQLERAQDEDLAERLENDGKVDLYGIYFDIDKATLKPESEETLNQVLGLLKSKPTLRLEIGGHTDSQSSDTYNLDLSTRRAQSVVKWLTEKGIAGTRLGAEGFGESRPVADNASPAGRALNRRVEIRDITKEVTK